DHLHLKCDELDLSEWNDIVNRIKALKEKVTIALVGKYVELKDAYLSVAESLRHGGIFNDVDVEIKWIHSENVEDRNNKEIFEGVDGILVPGGFGERGIDGKISAVKYARENKIPYLGICLGMQLTVVEFARNVVGLKEAHSTEINPNTPFPVIDLMPEQKDIELTNGSMRLGLYPCKLAKGSKAMDIYKEELIYERHRHRHELNNQFRDKLEEEGLLMSGLSPDERLVEIVELKDHPWFIGVQFHPEFKSRPTKAHPLFKDFIRAAKENKDNK
ncbi:CTP synthase, partial [Schnuerera sp.]|uniref:CTP synthase n=1 Tax=Schnuerera sp. TaxID=2794844 RepID=UPI002C3354C8